MPFISYAQNFEDVLLWRALKGVQRGTYIDVGANHPVIGSVTNAFYERGWRGINIEPVAADHALLVEQRPGDINLQVAAGESTTTQTLFQFGVRGLATLSESVTARHKEAGLDVVQTEVKVRPLRELCAEYVSGEIHFLKIDVEGSEAIVLRGMDFSRWRPWLLVIEATLPNTQEPSHADWEAMVLEQGYVYCYFDGLSRYYVAQERERTLRPALSCQPNVFDDFVLARMVTTQEEVERLRARSGEFEARLRTFDESGTALARNQYLEGRVHTLEQELAASREAWNMSQVAAQSARREIAELEARLEALRTDPYFRTGEALRGLAQRLTKRITE